MYIGLLTRKAWEIEGGFDAFGLFRALAVLLAPTDIVAIGTYDATPSIFAALHTLESNSRVDHIKPYEHTFDLNRTQYPNGRAFDFFATHENLETVCPLSRELRGGVEKDLFFDHMVGYRLGIPVLPLFDFHDAFMGGTLHFSGLYSEKEIENFAGKLGAKANLVDCSG